MQQIACAVYLIDTFALRVGNEKSNDEADTFGVASLLISHIKLLPDNTIRLDFLGKDSIRYQNESKIAKPVYQKLKQLINTKDTKDTRDTKEELFSDITPLDINKYLQTFMKKLTAKVFRTYNASHLFSKELRKITAKYVNYDQPDNPDKPDKPDKERVLLDEFNKANIKVAKLCNHQKNIANTGNNTHSEQLKKIDVQIDELKKRLRSSKTTNKSKTSIRIRIKNLKAKKSIKKELKNISLGTSKINYIDPRIIISFIKENNLNINKFFTKSLQEKFKWALDVDAGYKF